MKCKRCGKKFKSKYDNINIYEYGSHVYTYLKCDYCGNVKVIEEYKDYKKLLRKRRNELVFQRIKQNYLNSLKYTVRKKIYTCRYFDKILIKLGVCIKCKRKKATNDLVVCDFCYNLEYQGLVEQYFNHGLKKITKVIFG